MMHLIMKQIHQELHRHHQLIEIIINQKNRHTYLFSFCTDSNNDQISLYVYVQMY